jgi:hypothetical protein
VFLKKNSVMRTDHTANMCGSEWVKAITSRRFSQSRLGQPSGGSPIANEVILVLIVALNSQVSPPHQLGAQ